VRTPIALTLATVRGVPDIVVEQDEPDGGVWYRAIAFPMLHSLMSGTAGCSSTIRVPHSTSTRGWATANYGFRRAAHTGETRSGQSTRTHRKSGNRRDPGPLHRRSSKTERPTRRNEIQETQDRSGLSRCSTH